MMLRCLVTVQIVSIDFDFDFDFDFGFALEADAGATSRAAGANNTNTNAVLSTPTITTAIRSIAISNTWLMFCRAGAAISAGVKPASAIPK